MYRSASNVRNRPQMYRSASNVQLSDWLRQILANQTAVHLRPIRTFEADSLKINKFLTFDSNSTSDRFYQMC